VLDKIAAFEKNLYSKMDSSFKSLTDEIIEKRDLTPEIEKQIKTIIEETLIEIK